MKYAKHTSVAPEKSRMEIEQAVKRYGADSFGFAQDVDHAMIQFRLTKPKALVVRFILPLSGTYANGTKRELDDQGIRQRWRALLLVIKAKLEAVETKIEEIEHAFMAEIVLPNGRTMAEWAVPQMKTMIDDGRMPTALLEFQSE